jgi:hypothetical protein
MKQLAILILCFASVALAEDFKTIDGKEYKNVTVSRVEPDGIVLTSSSGISKVYFTELPNDVRQRFHYDAAKAAAYSAQQNAALEQFGKQEQDAKSKQEKIHRLEALYSELDQQEDELMKRIAKGKVGQYQANPDGELQEELPFLHKQLDNVRHQKGDVRHQLEQAYHQ